MRLTSLVGSWLLNTIGSARDKSKFKNHGVLTNSPMLAPSKYGKALAFLGSSSQYISLGTGTKYLSTDTTFSVSVWFRTLATAEQYLFSNTKNSAGGGWALGTLAGKLRGGMCGNSSYLCDTQTTATYNDNKWHHVVAVFTTSSTVAGNNQVVLYVDGRYVQTDVNSSGDTYVDDSSPAWYIGRNLDGNYFTGSICNVKYYNVGLKQLDVTDLYLHRTKRFNSAYSHILNNYVFSVNSGSFALAGQDTGLLKGYLTTGATAGFSLVGQDSGFPRSYVTIGLSGAFVVSGNADLLTQKILTGTPSTYSLTATAADLLAVRNLTAESTTFAYTGQDVSLYVGRYIDASYRSYTVTGQDASIYTGRYLDASYTTFTLTGQDADTLLGDRTLNADSGLFSLISEDVTLNYHPLSHTVFSVDSGIFICEVDIEEAYLCLGRLFQVDSASLGLIGNDAAFIYFKQIVGDSSAFSLVGNEATLNCTRFITALNSTYDFVVNDSDYEHPRKIIAENGVFLVAAVDMPILVNRALTANSAGFSVNGNPALFPVSRYLSAEPGVFDLIGSISTSLYPRTLHADSVNFSLTEQDVALELSKCVIGGLGAFSVSGKSAATYFNKSLNALSGVFSFHADDPSNLYNRALSFGSASFTGVYQNALLPVGRAIIGNNYTLNSTFRGTLVSNKTLTGDGASFTLSGKSITVTHNRTLFCDGCNYLTEIPVAFMLCTKILTASGADFSLTGNSSDSKITQGIIANSGSFSVNGSASLIDTRILTASPTAYNVNWQSLTGKVGRYLSAGSISYSLQSADSILMLAKGIIADKGIYSFSGQNTLFPRTYCLTANAGQYAVSGNGAFQVTRLMTVDSISAELTVNAVTFKINRYLQSDHASLSFSGSNANWLSDKCLVGNGYAVLLSGGGALFKHDWVMTAVTGNVALTGYVTKVLVDRSLSAESARLGWTCKASLTHNVSLTGSSSPVTVSGKDSNLISNKILNGDKGIYTCYGFADLLADHVIAGNSASYQLAGNVLYFEKHFTLESGAFYCEGSTCEKVTGFTLSGIGGGCLVNSNVIGISHYRVLDADAISLSTVGCVANLFNDKTNSVYQLSKNAKKC